MNERQIGKDISAHYRACRPIIRSYFTNLTHNQTDHSTKLSTKYKQNQQPAKYQIETCTRGVFFFFWGKKMICETGRDVITHQFIIYIIPSMVQ